MYKVLFLFFLAISSLCLAQDSSLGGLDFDFGTETEATLTSSPDALTATVFPKFADGKIPSGSEVEVLIGFRNTGNKAFNITFIDASFNYPLDYSYYIQNFTRYEYGVFIRPQEEVTTSYIFTPDALLEMRDFGLVVNVFYNEVDRSGEKGSNFTSVVFNGTVDIVEPESGFDAQMFFAYLAITAVLGLLGYVLYRNVASWSGKGKRKTQGNDASSTKEIDNDWLAGTTADPTFNKKGGRSPSETKKQK
eukprot:TRINITY_DN1365_c0_g1_i1.p1 TRINITY_DN1365_c0_g1~~TRINITY_DN1365_c0_g1_i1.p1  ORF type:complete len:249 (+),score=67.81 TRINITY_DN1365_c0_g1_i1:131-877(+)